MRAALRGVFAAWGLPGRLRVDNGAPWGAAGGLPPDLALWAIGLGVGVHWNRPRRCQENARVERSHGVLQRWAELATCPDAAALQARLDALCERQRAGLAGRDGRTRAEAHPALAAGGRPYDPAREAAAWDERRVWRWLAARQWPRRVDRVGRISAYNRALGVGRAHAGQEVTLRFDAAAAAWVVLDARGRELRRHRAPELRRGRVRALTVSRRRPPRPRRRGAKHYAAPGAKPYAA